MYEKLCYEDLFLWGLAREGACRPEDGVYHKPG